MPPTLTLKQRSGVELMQANNRRRNQPRHLYGPSAMRQGLSIHTLVWRETMSDHQISGRTVSVSLQRQRTSGQTLWFLLALIICTGSLAIIGCGGDDDNKGQNSTANFANMAFAF